MITHYMMPTHAKQKILILNYAGFVIPRIANEVESLIQQGYQVTILLWQRGVATLSPAADLPVEANIQFFRYPQAKHFIGKLLSIPLVYFALRKQLKAQTFDILHCTHLIYLPLALSLRKSMPCKIIYDACEIYSRPLFNAREKWRYHLMHLFEKHYAKKVDGILTVDSRDNILLDFYRRCHHNVNALWNVCRANEPYNAELHAQLKASLAGQKILLYVGLIHPVKGVFVALQALALLRQDHPELRLLFVGSFATAKVQAEFARRVSALGLQDVVIHLGQLSMRNMMAYVKCSDIGLALYQPVETNAMVAETNNRKIFTFMTMGVPVIGPMQTLQGQFLAKNNVGLAVDVTNPKIVAESINKLLADSKQSKLFSSNAIHLIENKYNWRSQEQKLLSTYHAL